MRPRFGCPRWLPDGVHLDGRVRWVRTDPWETGFIDIAGDQGLLGQVDGRTSAAVATWLGARTQALRDGIEVVVIDPHAGYAAAVPQAAIPVDHLHLIMLANKAVTAVGQRLTRELLGRRGRVIDPIWANRRLLLRGHELLSPQRWRGCGTGVSITTHRGRSSPPGSRSRELRALRQTAALGGRREDIGRRLWAFCRWCADADTPELTTLAQTIQT